MENHLVTRFTLGKMPYYCNSEIVVENQNSRQK